MASHQTGSAQETQKLATDFLSQIQDGVVIALVGQLGSGKTTFVQGIGKALGVSRVISPTYNIVKHYSLKQKHGQIENLVHLDLYRLGGAEEARSFDLTEIFSQPHDLVLVEWAEKAEKLLPTPHYRIEFKYLGEDKREINIEKIS